MPPTVCTLAILASSGAPPQRSIARVSARRTLGSSNGFFLWLGSSRLPQFQSLCCTVILSPRAPTSSSRTVGGKPRNSIAARPLRRARSEERRVGKECRSLCDWSSDVCSSDLALLHGDLVAESADQLVAHGRREAAELDRRAAAAQGEIGRASCRERV